MSRFVGTRPWWNWVVAFTVGELLGFGAAALLGIGAYWSLRDATPAVRAPMHYATAIAGGLIEGAVLGGFQLRALRRILPEAARGPWLRNTAVAAALAWAAGMLAPTLDELIGLDAAVQIALWAPVAVFILLSIGVAQALALRGHVARPRLWIGANVLGWLAGLPWTFVLPALLPDTSPPWAFALCFVVAGVLMGASAGAVTGAFLPRLVRPTEA